MYIFKYDSWAKEVSFHFEFRLIFGAREETHNHFDSKARKQGRSDPLGTLSIRKRIFKNHRNFVGSANSNCIFEFIFKIRVEHRDREFSFELIIKYLFVLSRILRPCVINLNF